MTQRRRAPCHRHLENTNTFASVGRVRCEDWLHRGGPPCACIATVTALRSHAVRPTNLKKEAGILVTRSRATCHWLLPGGSILAGIERSDRCVHESLGPHIWLLRVWAPEVRHVVRAWLMGLIETILLCTVMTRCADFSQLPDIHM